MAAKRALVVDDSRSARAFLGRILERHDLVVDAVESAEEAIDYLSRQHPDVIFMDHLMPGMDGLHAVKLIKGDPRTATIPILMYTSQEGELYLSQARALGAVGVLPKQTRPGDVTKTLIQLRLVADRRETEAAAAAAHQTIVSVPDTTIIPPAAAADQETLTPEIRRLVAALLNDHSSEMRRFVVEHLESHADRIVGDVRLMLKDDTADVPAAAPAPPAASRRYWLILSGAVATAFAVASLWLWSQLMNSQLQTSQELAEARAELAAMQTRLQLATERLTEVRSAGGTPVDSAPRNSYLELVPPGETPLSGERVDHIQSRLEQLLDSGFRGRVQITSYAGRFCRSSDSASLPEGALPYAQCALSQLNPSASRESVAFANMLAAMRRKAGDAMDITQTVGAADQLAAPYPAVTDKLTAGEWNAAATLNNRVEVHWSAFR